ncbi:hypothetical protein SAMN02910265_02574 [Ruminococcus flavefaciens]|uniref:Dolichyl-phosphate-mannose-protein mannosyltransferase n=1 Tax=Ruminococcus flavefaciens TaxID=1265 RepID=A0A1H6KLK1_RUMFL|nr:hypothetical protein [Ruminococcus flavefaciens]SEH76582.1 hypothetical protein SAMN02910265_02574 [Ruminococcus flavefaciens]
MEIKKEKNSLLSGLTVLIIYISGLIFVGCFHEPWFDESQAWLIARCASFKELFTYVPHYEGHPPLWHLILSVFAKNGAPFDLTIKAINITFSAAAMALLIFRSPFPKAVRYILPFTYFFFYHYGVYCRPYSMTMLAFMLAAITYKNRNSKPWRYIFSLTFLCLTSAYGIMLAGGLCLVWTFEIISELHRGEKLSLFWKDKRFYALCFILLTAVMLLIMITPADDCFYGGVENKGSIIEILTRIKNYGTVIILPFESWSGVMFSLNGEKEYTSIFIAEIIIGALIWLTLILITRKNRKFAAFFVPYIIMTAFMAFHYMSAHHIGISGLFHVFIFWIMAEQEGGIQLPESFVKIRNSFGSPFIRKVILGVGVIICLMPVVYSIGASYMDIKGECGISKFAEIIKDNHLEDRKIMTKWSVKYDEGTDNVFKVLEIPSVHGKIESNSTYLMGDPVMIQPYFGKNIFMNFNVDRPDDLYMHYIYKEDPEAVFEKWREKGLPDLILDYCPIDEVYDAETLEGVKYLPVYMLEYSVFYKLDFNNYYERLYIREDLLGEYPQFKWIDDQRGNIYERK